MLFLIIITLFIILNLYFIFNLYLTDKNTSLKLVKDRNNLKIYLYKSNPVLISLPNKNIDLDTGQIKTDGRGTEIEHNLGPQSTSWFRSLNPSTQQQLITAAKACTAFKRQHGSAVDDMTVVGSYKTEAQFRAAILVLGCRI